MPNDDARKGLSRRSLIAGAIGLTAATAGGGLLSGCSGSSSASSGTGGAGAAARTARAAAPAEQTAAGCRRGQSDRARDE